MNYLNYSSYFVFGAIGLYVALEIIASVKKDRKIKRPSPPSIESARLSLHDKVKNLEFFIEVGIGKNVLGDTLVVKFSKEPPFAILMRLPLSHLGYYVETKIVKNKTK